ncbi:MAG TPA: serine hydrolase, partial [Ktedonobacteraceae bacterium]|nr:serine hydrolase [Ktedonobacteraceae bacterium]
MQQRVLLALAVIILLAMIGCSALLISELLPGQQTPIASGKGQTPTTQPMSTEEPSPTPTMPPTPTPTPTMVPTPTPTPTMVPTAIPSPMATPSPAATPSPTMIPSPTPTPIVNSEAAFLLDDATGKVLFEKNSHAHLAIASTTKMMTAIVAIEHANNLDEVVTIQQAELDEVPAGMSIAFLQAGDQMKLRDLLYGLLLPSGSDAAVVIAHTIGGSTANFVAMMNAKAQALQLHDTHFSNPHGFPAPDHYSSAADLTYLARYAMRNAVFAQIVGQQKYTVPATLHTHLYTWANGNGLLGVYQGMDGVKTGTSDASGYCMVFSARRNGRHLLGAELNAAPNAL